MENQLAAAQATIARQQKQLDALTYELQKFASLASHDMREPLRTINSFATLVARRVPETDAHSHTMLAFIEDAAKRMHRLLEDLIAFARAGVERSPREAVDLNEVLANVRMNLFQKLEASRAELDAPLLPVLMGHEELLTLLFQNLVGNAVLYVRAEQRPAIKIALEKVGEKLRLSVRDNGIGIAPENLEKIFEPFLRLHKRTDFEGSGLGLATCRKIVDLYGGRIWAESELGRGSAFFVELPGEMLAD